MTSKGKKAQRRAERKAALEAQKRRRRLMIFGGVGLVILAVLIFSATRPEPVELADVQTFADLGGGHLAAGDPVPEYNSSPATSGPHAPTPAACGIYTEELSDVVLVHNLEHGTVVIQYRPELSESDLAELEEFARSKTSHVLLAPREDLPSDVVVTGWSRMLQLDGAKMEKIEAFYDRWARIGPEIGVACPFGIDQGAG